MSDPTTPSDPLAQMQLLHGLTRQELLNLTGDLAGLREELGKHRELFYGNGDWSKGVLARLQALDSKLGQIVSAQIVDAKGKWEARVALITSGGAFLTVLVPKLLELLK